MIRTVRTTADNADFINLTRQLDAELLQRYPLTQHEYDLHNVMSKQVKVVLAIENGEALGCGAFRELPNEEVEIKRMFVQPIHRGKGLSKLLLRELEAWALEEKYIRAKLETGNKQPEAVHAYTSAGYTQIPNYGPYQGMAESICMQKELRGTLETGKKEIS